MIKILISLGILILVVIVAVIFTIYGDIENSDDSEAENHEHSIGTKDNDHD